MIDWAADRIPNSEEVQVFVMLFSAAETFGGHYLTEFETGAAKGIILDVVGLAQTGYSVANELSKGSTTVSYNIGNMAFDVAQVSLKATCIAHYIHKGASLRMAGERCNYFNVIGKFGTISGESYDVCTKAGNCERASYWEFLQQNLPMIPQLALKTIVTTPIGVWLDNKASDLFWNCGAHPLINTAGNYILSLSQKLIPLADTPVANLDSGIWKFIQHCDSSAPSCKWAKTTYMSALMFSSLLFRGAALTVVLWPVNVWAYDLPKAGYDAFLNFLYAPNESPITVVGTVSDEDSL